MDELTSRLWRTRLVSLALLSALSCSVASAQERPRARDLDIIVGTFEPGTLNAITDVPGVRVGQATIVKGEQVRTGVDSPDGWSAILEQFAKVFAA